MMCTRRSSARQAQEREPVRFVIEPEDEDAEVEP
jgi:hypothetical protein